MQFLRRNWVGVMFCFLGLLVAIAFPFVWRQNRVYRAAAPCAPSAPTSDCRAALVAEVLEVERHGSRRSPTQRISFLVYGGPVSLISASFSDKGAGAAVVKAGDTVSVELWDRKITAMTVDRTTYRSFEAQKAPWWLIPMGLLLAILGVIMIATGTAGTFPSPRRTSRSSRVKSLVRQRTTVGKLTIRGRSDTR